MLWPDSKEKFPNGGYFERARPTESKYKSVFHFVPKFILGEFGVSFPSLDGNRNMLHGEEALQDDFLLQGSSPYSCRPVEGTATPRADDLKD